MNLPKEYEDYIAAKGIFEGSTTGEPGYIMLWPPDELDSINTEISIAELAPGYNAFASNGGNEVIAFNAAGTVFMIPLIGMDSQYVIQIAETFGELASRFEENRLTQKY